ncbi:RIP metalloprotease RseP [bacterium]|nr:RIP metalloprotease RseP [bacterium]
MLITILSVIVVFGVIIAVHEWGHMIAAKLCGVAVPDFALGFGPSLASFSWGGTRYHLCALPIGGFVRIAGLEDKREGEHPIEYKKTWQAKNGWQKAFILVGGPFMNFVLALAIMLSMGLIGFPRNMVVIAGVEPDSPAAEAGIQPLDQIAKLDGKVVTSGVTMVAWIRAAGEREIELELVRRGETIIVSATPRVIPGYNDGIPSLGFISEDLGPVSAVISIAQPKTVGYELGLRVNDRLVSVNGEPARSGMDLILAMPLMFDEKGKAVDEDGEVIPEGGGTPVQIGVERDGVITQYTIPGHISPLLLGIVFKPYLERLPLGESLQRSLQDSGNMMYAFLLNLRMLFTSEGVKQIGGPVAIANIIGQSAKSDWYTFLQIVVLININLGLINLFPLPALDGGRLVFVGLAGLGIRISEKREAYVHSIGMVMLLGLIGLVTFTDIMAFF